MSDAIASLFISLGVDDKASAPLGSVNTALGGTVTKFDEAAAHAGGFGGSLESTAASSKSFSQSIGGAATSLAGVVSMADRAMNLMDRYEITQITVENATMRVAASQTNLNEAIQKYGTGSQQAIDAARQLEIANNNLDRTNIRAQSSMVMIGVSALVWSGLWQKAQRDWSDYHKGAVLSTIGGTISGALAVAAAGVTGSLPLQQLQ